MADLIGVPAPQVLEVWSEVRPWVVQALKRGYGRYLDSDILEAILSRNMQLWIAREGDGLLAVCVTEIIRYPRKSFARVMIGTGRERQKWQDFVSIIEDWAKAQGCAGLEMQARCGWERIHTGYKKSHVFLEKEF